MTLLIDVGNTRIKLGYSNHPLTFAIAHDEVQQILVWLEHQALTPKKALGICVSSMALAQKIEKLLLTINCSMHWLDATLPCALLYNNYEEPQRLGADRWLALIGVLNQQQSYKNRPIIHASFGTATTVDAIIPPENSEQKAQFIGGLILPGPQLMYDSLALNTAQLGHGIGATQPFPKNTRAAISSGISGAQAGAVLRQWELARRQQQGAPLLVCSGGGWDLIQEEVTHAYTHQLKLLQLAIEAPLWQPTPVLDGLSYISKKTN